jgi:hypothetical protein
MQIKISPLTHFHKMGLVFRFAGVVALLTAFFFGVLMDGMRLCAMLKKGAKNVILSNTMPILHLMTENKPRIKDEGFRILCCDVIVCHSKAPWIEH